MTWQDALVPSVAAYNLCYRGNVQSYARQRNGIAEMAEDVEMWQNGWLPDRQ
jgi:hypothetical protein